MFDAPYRAYVKRRKAELTQDIVPEVEPEPIAAPVVQIAQRQRKKANRRARAEALELAQRAEQAKAAVARLVTGQLSLYLFDCSYKHKEATAKVHDSHGTACLVQSGRFRSVTVPLQIVGRDWTEVMIADKVDMGQSPFAEKFRVLSKDPGQAREIVNTSIQAIMLQHLKKPLYNPVGVSLGPSGAIVLADRTFEHDLLQDILDLARQIEAAIE